MLFIAEITLLKPSFFHTVNVLTHVLFGTAALLIGIIPFASVKSGVNHVRFGRYFFWCVAVVVISAALGAFVFAVQAFLGLLTLLSAYQAFGAYRAVRRKCAAPHVGETALAVLLLGLCVLFVAYIRSIHFPWSPVIIYSTLGWLVITALYDVMYGVWFSKKPFTKRWWLFEHIVKVIGAYTALLSAFAGTVFEQWQPYSQILPNIFGIIAIIIAVGSCLHEPFPKRVFSHIGE